ncbi:MAG: N-acetylglucosamine-6-phosphate deacetylase [Ruminococcaceae bacterium]|nr:N-acetylglucosamine-6-phosphate deacetylase [Oscillospiraceae bacterium]
MQTKIINAILVTDVLDSKSNLYFEDGRIVAVTPEDLPCDQVIDATGLYVCPGFIDIHTHGAGDHDFGDGTADDIRKAAYAHAKHGTTTIYPTCTTTSTEGILQFILNVKDVMKENTPGMPYVAGSHLEGPYFCQGMRGAQNPAYIKAPVPEEYRRFIEAGEGTVRRISFAPELEGSLELCEYLVENGVVAAFGHTEAIYEELLPVIRKGCKLATHLYSGMNLVTRRGPYRKLGAVETAFLEDDVTVEIIADGVHLPKELLQLIYKLKGSDKICLITDSMRGAGMPEGPTLLGPKADNFQCIIKDGVAMLPDMTAFAGSVATADRLIRVMHKEVGIPLTDCIKMMCQIPAKTMGLHDRGKLEAGFVADLVFFDEDINIQKVILQGQELQAQ